MKNDSANLEQISKIINKIISKIMSKMEISAKILVKIYQQYKMCVCGRVFDFSK